MNRRALYVLAQAAASGVAEAAMLPASAFDPFLRPFVRSAVRHAIARAEAALPEVSPEHQGERLLKLAFVLEHPGKPAALDAKDAAAVDAAFAALSPPFAAARKTTRPITLGALVLVFGAAAAALAVWFWPTPEDRFVKSAFGRALAGPLTDWVAAMGRPAKASDAEIAKKQLLSSGVKAQIGDEAHALLAEALERAEALEKAGAGQAPATEAITAAMRPLYESTNALNQKLEARRVPAMVRPYALDSSRGRSVWVIGYYLRDKSEIELAGQKAKVAWGRRLDNLNLDTNSEIYKDDLGDTYIVPLEAIEARFLDNVLPSLARDVPLPFAREAQATSALAALSKKLVDRARDDYFAHTRLTKDKAESLDTLVRQRNAAIARLKGKDYWVHGEGGLLLAPSTLRALERRAKDPDIEDLIRQNDHLAGLRPFVATATDPVAALVEESWVSYRLELARLKDKPVKALEAHEADEPTPRAWLSARLASLARPHTIYALALIEAIDPLVRYGSRAERTAAITLFGALLPQLGLPAEVEWSSDGLHRDALATALGRLVDKPKAEIQAAATKTYVEVFGEAAPAYRRTSLLR